MQPDRRNLSRRESDREPGLDRDDLFLLMESYRNTIELNTTLLERQETLNQGIERVLKEIGTVCSQQLALIGDIKGLPAEMREMIDALCSGTAARCDDLKKAIDGNRDDELKEHSAHKINFYGAFVGLVTIILALLGLIAKLWPAKP